jgi:hypothetical protein
MSVAVQQPARKASRPKSRSIWFDPVPADTSRRHIRLTVDGTETDYWLQAIPADFGTAFKLEKFAKDGGEVYHVNLDAKRGHHTCECLGHLRWGHRTQCRHVAALLALQGRKLI